MTRSAILTLNFGDVVNALLTLGFEAVLFADDLNGFKPFHRLVANDVILNCIQEVQEEVHLWEEANQVTFDAGKEHVAIISNTDPYGECFKILGIRFDTKLLMSRAILECVSEAGWKFQTLLRTARYHNDANLFELFKSHVVSFLEYRTAGIYHAASSNLAPLDRILDRFCKQIGVSSIEAYFYFNMAPLGTRRDVAMLGLIHRSVLGIGPQHFQKFFKRFEGQQPRRSPRFPRHSKQLVDPCVGNSSAMLRRSALGLVRIYNLLPEQAVQQRSVKSFQQYLNKLLRNAVESRQDRWQELVCPRISGTGHPLMNISRAHAG